jgi:hypothetical protein
VDPKAWKWTLLVAASCATTNPPWSPSPVNVEARSECTAATQAAASALLSPALTTCERDGDCAEASSVLGGRCGLFVNRGAFSARFDEWEVQVEACDSLVQVAADCPDARPVCEQGRCAGVAQARRFEPCAAARGAFKTRAATASVCEVDEDCTRVDGVITSTWFEQRSEQVLGALRAACFETERLTATRTSPPEPVFCVENRCSAASTRVTPIVIDLPVSAGARLLRPCALSLFATALGDAPGSRKPGAYALEVKFRVDARGIGNRYDFLRPNPFSEKLKYQLATQLHACRFEPAMWKGAPYASDYTLVSTFTAL